MDEVGASTLSVEATNGQVHSVEQASVQLTVEQAAKHAHLSTKTIRRMIGRGQLATARVGLAYVIELTDLERAMSDRLSMDRPPLQAAPRSVGIASLASAERLRSMIQDAVRTELAPLIEELQAVRGERDRLAEQLRMLAAPSRAERLWRHLWGRNKG